MVYFALYIELETSNKDSNELKNIEFLFKLYNNGIESTSKCKIMNKL